MKIINKEDINVVIIIKLLIIKINYLLMKIINLRFKNYNFIINNL